MDNPNNHPTSKSLGDAAELFACEFLLKNGLKLISKNFKRKGGEIDLIMKEGEYIVFVEVRSRNANDYSSALESIGPSKQSKLRQTATLYLLEEELLNKKDCRFDVVTLDNSEVDWIKNAFSFDHCSY